MKEGLKIIKYVGIINYPPCQESLVTITKWNQNNVGTKQQNQINGTTIKKKMVFVYVDHCCWQSLGQILELNSLKEIGSFK